MEKRSLDKAVKPCLMIAGILTGVTALALLGSAAGVNRDSICLLYLLGVLFSSVVTYRYGFGLAAAILHALSFNYFFTDPTFSFKMVRSDDVSLILFFLITAIAGSALMTRLRRQITAASQNEEAARMLYEVANKFVRLTGKETILQKGIDYIQGHSRCLATVELLGEEVAPHNGAHPRKTPRRISYSIPGTAGSLGDLIVTCPEEGLDPKEELLFSAVAAQMGAALEREGLYREREEIRVAIERERSRSTFLRAVAHDIRTPLTALSGASNLLAEGFDRLTPEEKRKLAADISEETVWLSNLVENILNMTRLDQGKLMIHRDFEVIDDVVSEAVGHMERLWGGRSLFVRYPQEVVALPIDGKLIVQVLINLFDNAIKHTRAQDEITLTITIEENFAVFCVENPGESIPRTHKKSIFDSFFTADGAFSDKGRGVGLGLPICRAIVEAHGGGIWVEDKEPQGARFLFTLPKEA